MPTSVSWEEKHERPAALQILADDFGRSRDEHPPANDGWLHSFHHTVDDKPSSWRVNQPSRVMSLFGDRITLRLRSFSIRRFSVSGMSKLYPKASTILVAISSSLTRSASVGMRSRDLLIFSISSAAAAIESSSTCFSAKYSSLVIPISGSK